MYFEFAYTNFPYVTGISSEVALVYWSVILVSIIFCIRPMWFTMYFTERKMEYYAHAQTVCTRPSPCILGGAWA